MGASRSVLMASTRLAAIMPDPVLDGAGDAAGDVQLRRDALAGLADLVGVRPPAVVGDDAGAADGAAEQPGQLLERRRSPRPSPRPARRSRRPRRRSGWCRPRPGHPLDDAGAPGGWVRAPGVSSSTVAPASAGRRARRPGTACAAHAQDLRTGASSVACSSRLPPQRTRGDQCPRALRPPRRPSRWRRRAGPRWRQRGRAPRCRGRCPTATTAAAPTARATCRQRVTPRLGGVVVERPGAARARSVAPRARRRWRAVPPPRR